MNTNIINGDNNNLSNFIIPLKKKKDEILGLKVKRCISSQNSENLKSNEDIIKQKIYNIYGTNNNIENIEVEKNNNKKSSNDVFKVTIKYKDGQTITKYVKAITKGEMQAISYTNIKSKGIKTAYLRTDLKHNDYNKFGIKYECEDVYFQIMDKIPNDKGQSNRIDKIDEFHHWYWLELKKKLPIDLAFLLKVLIVLLI